MPLPLTAFCAIVAFPTVDGAPAAEVGESAYLIIPALIAKLPVALAAFMLAGLIACQMPTVDTFVNVSTLAVSHDLLEPALVRKGVNERGRLRLARWLSVAGFIGTVGMYFYEYKWLQGSYQYNYVAAGVVLSSVTVIVISLLTPKPRAA